MKHKESKGHLKPFYFKQGNLLGIGLHITSEYREIAYPDGNTDAEMITDILDNVPKRKTIFDVGTFIGASSLLFAKMVGGKGRVIGFEPNPFNRERIEKNLLLNKELSSRIIISPVALSNTSGKKIMTMSKEIDNGHSSTSRLNQSHPTLHTDQLPEDFEEIEVDVTTLDNYVASNCIFPDIIKVDIEGAEYDFLEGGRETIRKHRPVLYIEIHSEFCAVMCLDFLNSEGYRYEILHEEEDNRIMIKAFYSDESLYAINKRCISVIQKLENSLSWKVTKPFRELRLKLSLPKKKNEK